MTLDSVTQASDQSPEWSETEGGTVLTAKGPLYQVTLFFYKLF